MAPSRPLRRGGAVFPEPAGAPTPERRRHQKVERLEQPIADENGRPARPYRTVDTLLLMQRRGLDWSRFRSGVKTLRPDADAVGVRAEAARRAVWRAIQAVGGIASPAGSCLWHVVGWEQSLKEWACGQGWNGRRVSQEAASGILIAALGALEVHFGIAKNCE